MHTCWHIKGEVGLIPTAVPVQPTLVVFVPLEYCCWHPGVSCTFWGVHTFCIVCIYSGLGEGAWDTCTLQGRWDVVASLASRDGGVLQSWTGFSHASIHTEGGAYTLWLDCNISIVVFFVWSTGVLSLVSTPHHYIILLCSCLSQIWCILYEARNVSDQKESYKSFLPFIVTLTHNTWDLK